MLGCFYTQRGRNDLKHDKLITRLAEFKRRVSVE